MVWVRELLALSQEALRARVKSMSEEVLRRLLKFLESCDQTTLAEVVPSGCSINSDSEELSEGPEPAEPVLAICAVAEEDDATDEEAHEGAMRDSDQQSEARKPLRGIWRSKSDSCYTASVGFKGVGAYSQRSVDLDKIIDMHISMVRMRQRFYEHLESGRGLAEALRDAVTEMQSSRATSQSPAIRIRFRCRRVSSSNRNLDLEELVLIWESKAKNLEMHRQEKEQEQQRREERRQQKQLRAAERNCLRAARRRAREERAEASLQRQAAARAQKLVLLRQEVKNTLQRLCTLRERFLQKAWGVKALPDGLVLGKAPGFQGALVCAQLRLQNGSLCTGPLRKDLSQAKNDLRELSILQRKKGDEALRAELQHRELEAMTTIFMSGMAP